MENLDKFAEKLINYLESGELFLQQQMPDFVNQFVAYETWAAQWHFWFFITLTIVLILIQICMVWVAVDSEEGESWIGVALFGVIGALSLMATANKYTHVKKLEIAPKVYMIEAARDMMNGRGN